MDSLPPEILLEIFQWLHKSDIQTVALVNRQMARLTEPTRWEALRLTRNLAEVITILNNSYSDPELEECSESLQPLDSSESSKPPHSPQLQTKMSPSRCFSPSNHVKELIFDLPSDYSFWQTHESGEYRLSLLELTALSLSCTGINYLKMKN